MTWDESGTLHDRIPEVQAMCKGRQDCLLADRPCEGNPSPDKEAPLDKDRGQLMKDSHDLKGMVNSHLKMAENDWNENNSRD